MPAPKSLFKDIRRSALFGLGALLCIVLVIQVVSLYYDYAAIAAHLRQHFVNDSKEEIQREVRRVVEHVNFERSQLPERATALARRRVQVASDLIDNLLAQHGFAASAKAHAEHAVLDALRAIRYDEGRGYFFVFDARGRILLHPAYPEREGQLVRQQPELAGIDLSQVLQELRDRRGEATLSYEFPHPGQPDRPVRKITQVKRIPSLNWIVGTGVYLDDLESGLKQDLLAELQGMRIGASGYLFVDDWQGVVLAHGGDPALVGRNILDHVDTQGVRVVEKLIEVAREKDGGFVHYRWQKPGTSEEFAKVSFAQGVPEWQWLIGTGIYVDESEAEIDAARQIILHGLRSSVLAMLAGGLALGLFFYFGLANLYAAILADLDRFKAFFRRTERSAEPMDGSGLRYQEHLELATQVNEMFERELAAEQDLREHQANLENVVRERTAQLEQKTRELENLASIDPLTGVMNRRAFLKFAQRETARAARHGNPLSMLFLDIDHFKRVNDQYGHAVGDEVLKHFVEVVRRRCRSSDLLSRWGGEEFIVLAPETALDDALAFAEAIRLAVGEAEFPSVGKISCSIGVARLAAQESLDSLCGRADAALYEAKSGGRNRVCPG